MVCTGAKSERDAKRAVASVTRKLRKGGVLITEKPEVRIENVVASGSLGKRIDIEEVCRQTIMGRSVMYEPDQFPGAIYRMKSPYVVFLLFSSGEVVCVGAKKEEEVYEATEKLRLALEEIGVLYEEKPNH